MLTSLKSKGTKLIQIWSVKNPSFKSIMHLWANRSFHHNKNLAVISERFKPRKPKLYMPWFKNKFSPGNNPSKGIGANICGVNSIDLSLK